MNGRLIWTARVYDRAPALLIHARSTPTPLARAKFWGQSWSYRNPHSCPYNMPTFQLI